MKIFILFLFFVCANIASAQVIINEIMYDVEGADTGREWVEIFNNGDAEVDLSEWKFNDDGEGNGHGLNDPGNSEKSNGGQGSIIIPAGGYVILSGNAEMFLSEHQSFNGTVIDTVMSLNNTAGSLSLVDENKTEAYLTTYKKEMGANGDGNSLQNVSGDWVFGIPTIGVQNISSSGAVNEQSQSDSVSQQESVNSGASQNSSGWVDLFEGQIRAYAGKDITYVAGGDIVFEGKALGLKNEPLENARYLWNFGDGVTAEGQTVRHSYKYPSGYIVWLNVASGKYSSGDKAIVKIIPNELIISKADNNLIELNNGSNLELDISGWFLEKKGVSIQDVFRFPEMSFVRPNSSLPFSSAVTGISVQNGEMVELLYPNGIVAYTYGGEKKAMESLLNAGSSTQAPVSSSSIKVATEQKNIKNQMKAEAVEVEKEKQDSQNALQVNPGQASVISVTQASSWNLKDWFLLALMLGVLAGISFVFLRKDLRPEARPLGEEDNEVNDYGFEIEEIK